MDPLLACQSDGRRQRLASQQSCRFNGLDYVNVIAGTPPKLEVHFYHPLTKESALRDIKNYAIESEREPDQLKITDISKEDQPPIFELSGQGNRSEYRLRVLDPVTLGIDPRFSVLSFRFPHDSGDLADIDLPGCPSKSFPEPQIDYLARDYGRLRRLLLDRLSVTMPEWRERHVPDIGLMLVELFAYVGDHLGYHQDAIATEAYLGTARRRISVRRHARLVDYRLHEGCNARTFLHIEAPAGDELDPEDVVFVAGLSAELHDPQVAIPLAELETGRHGPLAYFEAQALPDEDWKVTLQCLLNPSGFLKGLARARSGPLAAILQSLPADVAKEVCDFHYNPKQPAEEICRCLLSALNVSLREITLARSLADECAAVSEATRKRIATQESCRCPGRCNRAVLEDLYPEWIARRVTRSDKIRLYRAHNEIRFYTWDGVECWLPEGATRATLRDNYTAEPSETGPLRALRHLRPGMLLLLEEVRDSRTGNKVDLNPVHRQVVRLTEVVPTEDPLVPVLLPNGDPLLPGGARPGQPVVEIRWHPDDALPFPLCLAARGRSRTDCGLVPDVSVARGNMILADHGLTVRGEPLKPLAGDTASGGSSCGAADESCGGSAPDTGRQRGTGEGKPLRPTLERADLTFSQPLTPISERNRLRRRTVAAVDLRSQLPHKAEPQIILQGLAPAPDGAPPLDDSRQLTDGASGLDPLQLESLLARLRTAPLELCRSVAHLLPAKRCQQLGNVGSWTPRSEAERELLLALKNDIERAIRWTGRTDLIDSVPGDQDFTIEIDDERRTHLRFQEHGPEKPVPGTLFWSTYRVGNGTAGNVGAEGITHLVFRSESLSGRGLRVRNPLAAIGGMDPESLPNAKLMAPHVTRKLKRAVTAEDYATVVQQEFGREIQRARASIRITPLEQQVEVAVDPFDAVEDVPQLLKEIETALGRFRRIGHDVAVVLPKEVPVHLELSIRVADGYLFEHIRGELLRSFSHRRHGDRTLGFFHPDNRSFGDGVFASAIVAEARKVVGVRGVTICKLQRLGEPSDTAKNDGILSMGPLEVAVLDRDDRSKQRGILEIYDDEKRATNPLPCGGPVR